MSCQCQRGRHRAPTQPLSRFVLPSLVVSIMPIAIVSGLLNPTTNPQVHIGSVDPYAGTITIAATPLVAPEYQLALPAEIEGTNHPTHPSGSSYRATESATGSPVTTSTTPALPTTQGQDREAPTANTEPQPSTSKIQANPECEGLNSQPNVIRACNAILAEFPEVKNVIGHAHRPKNPKSCHHRGMALDLMTPSNELGDRIFAWAKAHKAEFEIGWMGWEVPDHFDHVHLSFNPCKG